MIALTDTQKKEVAKLLDLAQRVSGLDRTCPLCVLEVAADELTWQKMQVLRSLGW